MTRLIGLGGASTLSVIRRHDTRDRDASESAYRRGQESRRHSAGATVVNPFLPGTAFYKAFEVGAAEAQDNALSRKTIGFVSQPLSSGWTVREFGRIAVEAIKEEAVEGVLERFEIIPEPSGTWAIFDALLGVFAQLRGETLIGLDEHSAGRLIERLRLESGIYTPLPRLETAHWSSLTRRIDRRLDEACWSADPTPAR